MPFEQRKRREKPFYQHKSIESLFFFFFLFLHTSNYQKRKEILTQTLEHHQVVIISVWLSNAAAWEYLELRTRIFVYPIYNPQTMSLIIFIFLKISSHLPRKYPTIAIKLQKPISFIYIGIGLKIITFSFRKWVTFLIIPIPNITIYSVLVWGELFAFPFSYHSPQVDILRQRIIITLLINFTTHLWRTT